MQNNLFINLSKYISCVRNTEEDRFTTILAAVLNHDCNLVKCVLKGLFRKAEKNEMESKKEKIQQALREISRTKKWKIEDQSVQNVGRFDIQISDETEKFILIIESKIGSTGQERQLKKYINWAKEQGESQALAFVCYITLYDSEKTEKHESNPYFLGHFYWSEIYELIKQYVEKKKDKDLFVRQLLSFMEDNHMSVPEPFNERDYKRYRDVGLLYAKLCNLVENLKKHLESQRKKLKLVKTGGRRKSYNEWICFEYKLKKKRGEKKTKFRYDIGFSLVDDHWKDFYLTLHCMNKELAREVYREKAKKIKKQGFEYNPQPDKYPKYVYVKKWGLQDLLTGSTFSEQCKNAASKLSDYIKRSNRIISRF